MSLAALDRAIDCLQVVDVYLRHSTAKLAPDFDPKRAKNHLAIQVRHGSSEEVQILDEDPVQNAPLAIFLVETGVRLVERDSQEKPGSGGSEPDPQSRVKAELSATFAAEYLITRDQRPDGEALKEFQAQNVLFHVWPYWREYVQHMCARLRLPDIVLPMFRLPESHRRGSGKRGAEPS